MEVKAEGNTLVIDGEIDQDTDFTGLIPEVGNPCVLDLGHVEKINSTGVKGWIGFWESKVNAGINLVFKNCSVAIVEQLNMVKSFACGASIESFQAPYICNECDHEWSQSFDVNSAKSGLGEIPCPKCNSTDTEVDEIEEEYLSFLK